jgi:hypothetical protein
MIALFLYLPTSGLAPLYIVSLIFGLSQGGIVPSYAIIVREYLPPREAGAKVGFVIMATIVGMALGGWMSGWIYDLTGSYRTGLPQRHRLQRAERGGDGPDPLPLETPKPGRAARPSRPDPLHLSKNTEIPDAYQCGGGLSASGTVPPSAASRSASRVISICTRAVSRAISASCRATTSDSSSTVRTRCASVSSSLA